MPSDSMGRTEPTVVLQPQAYRRDARAKQAKLTLHKTIPALLASNARARKGAAEAELIANPPPVLPSGQSEGESSSSLTNKSKARSNDHAPSYSEPALRVSLRVTDTLEAARDLSRTGSGFTGKCRTAILNMASPLRPGGGFLNGATSQEEFLCMRTTLYPSLQESFYRLPEVGGVWTPDVLVFRNGDMEDGELRKEDRFFLGVVTAGMLRFPDVETPDEGEPRYASAKDRELVEEKMRAVMRILSSKKIEKCVLGAWGCGAYGNPVQEIVRAWKRVLLGGGGEGSKGKKRKNAKTQEQKIEKWEGMKEVVFAVKDSRMAREFARHFGDGLYVEESKDNSDLSGPDESNEAMEELKAKIKEMEGQIAQVMNPDLKSRLGIILEGLKSQLDGMEAGGDQSDESEGIDEDHIASDEGSSHLSDRG